MGGAALHNLSEWCFMSFIFYQRPLDMIATYTHLFGTILPLVVENFVVGQDQTFSSIMEGLIGFSVPVTMVLYTEWCTMYQDHVAVFSVTPNYLVVQRPEAIRKCSA